MKTFKNESDVKDAVKKIFKDHGWFYWMPPANAFGRVGIADFHAMKHGVFLAVETKFGTNAPSAMQDKFLRDIAGHGGRVWVVTDRNLHAFAADISSWWAENDRT